MESSTHDRALPIIVGASAPNKGGKTRRRQLQENEYSLRPLEDLAKRPGKDPREPVPTTVPLRMRHGPLCQRSPPLRINLHHGPKRKMVGQRADLPARRGERLARVRAQVLLPGLADKGLSGVCGRSPMLLLLLGEGMSLVAEWAGQLLDGRGREGEGRRAEDGEELE